MQRNGFGDQKGLIFVMNNRGDAWNGAWVRTQWKNATLIPAAWGGRNDTDVPRELRTLRDGSVEFFAPPRGYAVYVPRE
jgi:alpha-amylase